MCGLNTVRSSSFSIIDMIKYCAFIYKYSLYIEY